MAANNAEVVVRTFTTDQLRELKTFKEFGAFAQETGMSVIEAADVLGDGFELLEDKAELIGKRFAILDFRFSTSEKYKDENGNPGEFVTVRLVTEDDRKLIINDGSTGIRAQLHQLPEAAQGAVLLVNKGLRVSQYKYKDDKGREQAAETYYLAV